MMAMNNERTTAHVCKRTLAVVWAALQEDTLATLRFVACTAFVAAGLDRIGYEADVAIMDEATQASETDMAMILAPQPDLELVVLAGDIYQLGTLVLSRTANQNMYANVLVCSPMARILKGYARVASVRLVVNYRSHQSIVEMPSAVFYKGNMVAAPDHGQWDNAWARQVKHALRGARIYIPGSTVEALLPSSTLSTSLSVPAAWTQVTSASSQCTRPIRWS